MQAATVRGILDCSCSEQNGERCKAARQIPSSGISKSFILLMSLNAESKSAFFSVEQRARTTILKLSALTVF
jgi:hypothetical protein